MLTPRGIFHPKRCLLIEHPIHHSNLLAYSHVYNNSAVIGRSSKRKNNKNILRVSLDGDATVSEEQPLQRFGLSLGVLPGRGRKYNANWEHERFASLRVTRINL